MSFEGFPVAALDFYDDLEVDNTKSFWEAHKQVYAESVKAPMEALCAELAPEFGTAKIFRPYRDVRFSKDKTPYKTHQGAFVAAGPSLGFYVQLSPRGVMVGGGFYEAGGERLAAIRAAIADDHSGPVLRRHLTTLEKRGFEVGGEKLKTSPRGYDADHPRIELLRHKQLLVRKDYGFAEVIHTPEVLEMVRTDWRSVRPLVGWLDNAVTNGQTS
ncbi:MAG: TIGR02453 family protein [Nocardioides sp.]|nr:TIGR02453 family protein [Nocardioides sp.]